MSINKKNDKKNIKKLQLPRMLTVFMLLALLVIGLVSTTFASFVPQNANEENGSLITQIKTAVANREKDDLADISASVDKADTGASVDKAETGATITSDGTARLYFNMKAVSWWTAGSNGDGNFAYFFNSSTYKWSAHAVQYSGDTYYVVIPSGSWTTVILTRNNTSTSPSWDNKWNQTGNITLSSSSNYISKFSEGSTSATWGTAIKPTSTASLTPVSNTGYIGASIKLTPSLTSNTSLNTIKSTTYSVSPSSGASVSSGVFTATAVGTYTVTATITYHPNGYSSLTSTVTASTTITIGYSFTLTVGTGGTATANPASGPVSSVSVSATANTGYTFVGWTCTNGSVASSTATSTTFTPTADNATVKANFRPDAPSALTLTGSNVASGTTGDGTSSNPYIVFDDGGFTLTAKATVVSGASARYSTSSNGTYSTTNTFSPSLATKGTSQSYTVYSKAYVTNYYSTSYKSATAYYMVFSHLNGANTGFSISSDSITDIESVTLSDAYVNGVADAEKTYIKQTYQVSSDNSTFSNLSGSTWAPNSTGTYYFRVKTTNEKTGETVYSSSKLVTVVQSTVYYDITVVNDNTAVAGTVKLYANGVEITDGKILSNSTLTVSVLRPSTNYYIDYLDVDTITEFDNEKVNGDIIDFVAYDHVKGDVTISYKLVEKPKVTVEKDTNAQSISFKYFVDGVSSTGTQAGTYHVDYNSKITYTVTPKTGYYVSSMTGVTIGTITSSAVTGTKSGVTQNISPVKATLTKNNTVTVNIDSTSASTDGASMTIDGTAQPFGTAKGLNYGVTSEVVITPPDGYYAVVSGNSVSATIDTNGKATFKVTLKGENKVYTVKFVENPKVYMVQPQYGSVYVTSGSSDNIQYYFYGDSVGYGTELTVHTKRDHANTTIEQVLVNGENIGTTDGLKFNIVEDSYVVPDITVESDHSFSDGTEYGTRRIFFTDNSGWGDGQVMVHYSNSNNNYTFTDGNTKAMTYKYTNDMSQRVYYADIPYNFKYVNFYKKSATTSYTASALIDNTANAFYHEGGTSPCAIHTWQENYSDFVATDRVDTIQQATTVKDEAAVFQYACDFGDEALTYEIVDGNDATVDFNKGELSITPTENTKTFTLVKVKSTASTTVKYYLIRVENFEIVDFSGLQKIYSSQVFNDIQLDLIVKGGVLNYVAKLYESDTNKSGSYVALTPNRVTGFEENTSLQAYTNSFLLEYQINTMSGVKYYKVEATDGANHKASRTMKTLFGTNSYNGKRCIYFYNTTDKSLSKYNVRACFKKSDTDYVFATMQPVGVTGYYRAVIPDGYSKVDFFITKKSTFTNNRAEVIDNDGNLVEDFCSNAVVNVNVPGEKVANIVYLVSSIDSNGGITGEFAQFDY